MVFLKISRLIQTVPIIHCSESGLKNLPPNISLFWAFFWAAFSPSWIFFSIQGFSLQNF